MSEGTPDHGVHEDRSKDTSPPQDELSRENSGTLGSANGDLDAESRGKRARTTIILREVDPNATETQILALFNNTEFKVISARIDVQNTWFVQLETEEQAKLAVPHLGKQTLCGNSVKARIKSEGGLRTSAPTWQPSVVTTSPPIYVNSQFTGNPAIPGVFQPPMQPMQPVAPPPGVVAYGGWANMKNAGRPPGPGAFKKVTPPVNSPISSPPVASVASMTSSPPTTTNNKPAINAIPQAPATAITANNLNQPPPQQQSVPKLPSNNNNSSNKSGQTRGGNNNANNNRSNGGGRNLNQDRRNRRPQNSSGVARPAPFQPQDFPSLTGQPIATPIASQPLPTAATTSTSWATVAKTAPETATSTMQAAAATTTTAVVKKKEQVNSPVTQTGQKSASPSIKEKANGEHISSNNNNTSASVVISTSTLTNELSPSTNPITIKTSNENITNIDEAKSNNAPSTNTTSQQQQDLQAKKRGWEKPGLPQPKKEISPPVLEININNNSSQKPTTGEQKQSQSTGKKSSNKKSGSKDNKNEKQEMNGSHSASSTIPNSTWGAKKSFAQVIKESSTIPTNVSPPLIKANENWGDVEDDFPATNTTSVTTNNDNRLSQQQPKSNTNFSEKITPSSENSDWRRDAATRRKNEESKKLNGSS